MLQLLSSVEVQLYFKKGLWGGTKKSQIVYKIADLLFLRSLAQRLCSQATGICLAAEIPQWDS